MIPCVQIGYANGIYAIRAKRCKEESMGRNVEESYKVADMVASSSLASADRDRLLVERARQGDTEAFGKLLEQHRNKAHGYAQRNL